MLVFKGGVDTAAQQRLYYPNLWSGTHNIKIPQGSDKMLFCFEFELPGQSIVLWNLSTERRLMESRSSSCPDIDVNPDPEQLFDNPASSSLNPVSDTMMWE